MVRFSIVEGVLNVMMFVGWCMMLISQNNNVKGIGLFIVAVWMVGALVKFLFESRAVRKLFEEFHSKINN